MDLDIRTLGLVISLVDLLLVMVFVIQYRTVRNYEGPGWWVLGFVATSAGLLLILLRDFIPFKLVYVILGNGLSVLGGYLIYTGVLRFLGKRESWTMILSVMLIFVISMAVFTYYHDEINIRSAICALFISAAAFMTTRVLLMCKQEELRRSILLMAIVLGAFGIVYLLRAIDALFLTHIDSFFTQGWFQMYGFLAILIAHVLLTYGLVFMVNLKLQGEMNDTKEKLALSQKQYQKFLNSTSDIVFLKDDQFRYSLMNDAQAVFFGKQEADLLGKTDWDLMNPEAAAHCHQTDREVLESLENHINCEEIGDLVYETRKFPVQLTNGKTGLGAFIRDITESRRAQEALVREQSLMQALMNSLPHHIYFKDLDSRFIRINEAHAQSFRLDSPDDAIGKSDLDFFSEEHAKQAFEDEQIIIRTGKSLITEEKETWEDRPDSWASTIKLPLVNRHGETIGTFGISSDITQRKQAEKEIASKNRQLEQMNSDKDKLFSIIAHDLRSPFNALLGLTGLMSDESESLTAEEMVKMAAMVRKSAVQINEELGNLLEWSRIQMNAVPVAPVLQNLGKVIDSELLLLGQASQRKSLRMINSIPPAIQVTADEQMLHSILRNLLANAIKFTRKGGLITICAKVTDEHFAEISVADTGIGMNPETLGRLFFMNENGCRKGTDGEPGSGLGLIICKELVEKMGGQVRAESEEGMGSTFSFSIPS